MTRSLRALSLALCVLLASACHSSAGGDRAPADNPRERSTEGTLPTGTLTFENGPEIEIEIAGTTETIRLGLSYRESLCRKCGLYFVFPGEDIRSFWMRQMRFPIDIIWINHGRVVGVVANAQPRPGVPESRLESFKSPIPVRNVLEVPAGFAAKHGIEPGTKVSVRMK